MAGKKKEELKLTTEQTERLIELYHEEVDLWNFSSANYHNKDCRRKALENILSKLQEEYPGLNGSCKFDQQLLLSLDFLYSEFHFCFFLYH